MADFVALGQTTRQWIAMTVAPNGNVYACVTTNGDIYMQTAGVGDFIALGQTPRSWRGMAAAPNGNVYACTWNSDIYMQTAGVGAFVALSQGSGWYGMAAAPNGNVYANKAGGDIYMQTAGVGNFIALGQISRQWRDMTAAPNGNVYAGVSSQDIYMQTAGVGNFIALGQTYQVWVGMAAAPNGNVYACASVSDIYMQTAGVGDFIALSQGAKSWRGMAAASNGNIYAGVINGDIYLSENPTYGNCTVRGVKVYLDDSYSAQSDIGLYEVGGNNSELRWAESDISGYAPDDSFLAGLLSDGWFDGFTDSYDGTYGGGVGEVGIGAVNVTSAVVYDDAQRVFVKVLGELGINLTGQRIDIIEFEIIDGSLVDSGGTVIYRGEIGDMVYDEYITKIEYYSVLLNRNANIGTIINESDYPDATKELINKMVPVTFGMYIAETDTKIEKITNGMARFQRVADKETKFSNANFDYLNRKPELNMFPLIHKDNDLSYSFVIDGNNAGYSFGGLDNLYVMVVDGKGVNYSPRKVNNIVRNETHYARLAFSFDSYYPEDLDSTGSSDDGRTWVQFVQIDREYQSDIWPCDTFLDASGVETSVPELYVYGEDDDQLDRVADYGYQIDTDTSDKNKLKIYPLHFSSSNTNTVDGYMIMPMSEVYLKDSAYLAEWSLNDYIDAHLYERQQDGWYAVPGEWFSDIDEIANDNIEYLSDKDSTTKFRMYINADDTFKRIRYMRVLGYKLPVINNNFDFSNCYLAIKSDVVAKIGNTMDVHYFSTALRRFAYKIVNPVEEKEVVSNYDNDTTAEIESIPDFYFTDDPETANEYFYRINETPTLVTGYETFDLNISDFDDYNAYVEGILVLRQDENLTSVVANSEFNIFDLGVIFTRSVDIKSYLYSAYNGRLFDSTFNSQSATDLIDNPKILLLHILMLQNWSETESDKSWGKEYPDTPLIDISSDEGGLNFSELDFLESMKIRRQIFDYSNSWTKEIIDSICNDFFLISTQDQSNGNERICFIGSRYSVAPTESVTLSDIIGNISSISIQPEKSIFCEPIVRYNYNIATESYDSIMQVINSSATSYNSDNVIGLSGSSAENVWNKCNLLWKRVGKIEQPPEQYTDKKWIYRDEDALWYLNTWLYYMGAVDAESGEQYAIRDRVSFDVHYSKGKTYFKGMHINLTLPFHTEDVTIECVIESITNGYDTINIQVMLLDNISEEDFYIIKSLTSTDEIEKVIPVFGDDNDLEKVI